MKAITTVRFLVSLEVINAQGDQTSRFKRDSPVFSPDFERPDFFSNVPFFDHFVRLSHSFVRTALTSERSIAGKKKYSTSVVDINGILLQAFGTNYNMMSLCLNLVLRKSTYIFQKILVKA